MHSQTCEGWDADGRSVRCPQSIVTPPGLRRHAMSPFETAPKAFGGYNPQCSGSPSMSTNFSKIRSDLAEVVAHVLGGPTNPSSDRHSAEDRRTWRQHRRSENEPLIERLIEERADFL